MSDLREAFEALDELVEMAVQHHGQVRAADEYRETIKAALQSQTAPAVPDGWKLVPVEPTDDMRKKAGLSRGADFYTISKVWHAMLAAAPSPDHIADGGKVEPVDGLSELIKWCRKIGYPMVSKDCAEIVENMQDALRRVEEFHPAQPRNEVQAEALEAFEEKLLKAAHPLLKHLAVRLCQSEAARLRSNGGEE